jgi:hypothetical protein
VKASPTRPAVVLPDAETKNAKARRLGIPKWLRRYCIRYGKGVDALATMHAAERRSEGESKGESDVA